MPHSEECREIFKGLMKNEAKVKNAEARKAEFEEKMRRKAEESKKKEEKEEKKESKGVKGDNGEEESKKKEEKEEKKESKGVKGDNGEEESKKKEEKEEKKESKGVKGDSGEDLLGSKEEKKIHREFLKEEKRRVEREWKEEKRRRIMEERKPKMGWSKPESPGWHAPKEGEEELHRPEGQMRADGAGKRPKEGIGEEEMDEERERKREKIEVTTQWESIGGENAEDESKRRRIGQVEIMRLECLVGEWVEEVKCQMVEAEEWEEMVQDAWDDVHEGHNLDPKRVKEGRKEELTSQHSCVGLIVQIPRLSMNVSSSFLPSFTLLGSKLCPSCTSSHASCTISSHSSASTI
jgi:hypothetical protein